MPGREVTLRGYIESLIKAHQREHAAHEQGHLREHANSRQAIQVAVDAMDKRLDGMNEIRASLRDAQQSFVSKDENQAEKAAIISRLDTLTELADRESRDHLPRSEYRTAHEPLSTRVDKLEDADIARVAREQEREASTLHREKERDEGIRRTMAFFALLATVGGFMLALIVELFRGR